MIRIFLGIFEDFFRDFWRFFEVLKDFSGILWIVKDFLKGFLKGFLRLCRIFIGFLGFLRIVLGIFGLLSFFKRTSQNSLRSWWIFQGFIAISLGFFGFFKILWILQDPWRFFGVLKGFLRIFLGISQDNLRFSRIL